MSGFNEKSERRVLPIWRSASSAAKGFELRSLSNTAKNSVKHVVVPDDLIERRQDFQKKPNVGTAADAINSAVLSKKEDQILDIAEFVIKNGDSVPEPLLRLARKLVKPIDDDLPKDLDAQRKFKIHELRHLLFIEPKNPILLVDLAREYSSIGKLKSANNAIVTALDLAKDNRWVNRMAARFFVHTERKNDAYNLIAKNPLTDSDPWLLAAEIAIAQVSGKEPKHWRRAKNILNSSLPQRHLSELACAVGTFEMEAGNNKIAKRNFRQALLDPTDNSLAQLKWAERSLSADLSIDPQLEERESAFEAKLWSAYYQGDIRIARKYANDWLEEEPFSKRPATMLSFLSSLLDDHDTSEAAARWGLKANPDDPTLKLNALFSSLSNFKNEGIALIDGVEKIERELKTIALSPDSYTHANANLGLLAYRTGQAEIGRMFYMKAAGSNGSDREKLTSATAKIFHAREAVIHRAPWAGEIVADAKKEIEKVLSPGLRYYLAKIQFALENPERMSEIFSPEFSELDSPAEIKNEKLEFDISRQGATIWLPSKAGQNLDK